MRLMRAGMEVFLLVISVLAFFAFGGGLLFGQTKPLPDKTHVSCIITNHPYDVYDAERKAAREQEDWHVDCTITRKSKVLYGPKPLVLPYPENFADATQAAHDFIMKGAAEILKQLKTEKEKHE